MHVCCRLKERLTHWMALSERSRDIQHAGAAKTVNGADTVGAAVSSNVPEDPSPANGCQQASAEPMSTEDAVRRSPAQDAVIKSSRSSPVRPRPPDGHPDFPLLPMSKGFRLTLQKSLVKFEGALSQLKQQQSETQADRGVDSNGAEAAAAPL